MQPGRISYKACPLCGEEAIVDLSGCAKQVAGPINCTLAMSSCAVYYAIMAAADEPVAANARCYRPVTILAPEGSVVNARHPAPVAHRIAVTHRLCNALLGALHQAAPDRIPAAYYGVSYVLTFQAIAADGDRKVLVEIEIGGSGGHPRADGRSTYSSGMHNNANIPIEMIESDTPVTIMEYALAPGSGGEGRNRGGLGLRRAWRIDAETATFTAQMDRFRFRPFGLSGGGSGGAGSLTLTRNGEVQPLHSKVSNMPLARGDIIRLQTSGGGGFGPPDERDARALERDRALGLVTKG